jgi:uncharacterized membrane protein
MIKTRLEGLSDGVFAIVFTILVLDIRIPDGLLHPTSGELYQALSDLWPVFIGYFISFIVLTVFWVGHTFFFGVMVKVVNRQLIILNMLYLSFVSLLPFSAYLLGKYPNVQAAVFIYGMNILVIGAFTVLRFEYALWSREIDTSHNPRRDILQARIRTYLTPATTFIGVLVSFVSLPFAIFLYAFPIAFNIVPGLLNALERTFGFRLGGGDE